MNYYEAIREEMEKRGVEQPRPLFVAMLRALHHHHKHHHASGVPTLAQQFHRWISMLVHAGNIRDQIRYYEHEGRTAEAEDLKNHAIDLEIIKAVFDRYLPVWDADGIETDEALKWRVREQLKLTKPDPEDDILKLKKDDQEPPGQGKRF
jgi:hypothetical protein